LLVAWHGIGGEVCFEGLRLPVLAEDDAFGELLGWFGGCASSRALGGGLRFCAVGCHFCALKDTKPEIPTRSLRDKGGVYNVKITDMDLFNGEAWMAAVASRQSSGCLEIERTGGSIEWWLIDKEV
jgi:hypothetical protein